MFSVKLLSPFISKSCTTRWGLRGAPGIAPVSWWWHHSRRRGGGALAGSRGLAVASLKETRGGTLVGSGALAVASLMETRGLLSRFDCVYSDYITQGCRALAVAMSLRARCAFFPTHVCVCK